MDEERVRTIVTEIYYWKENRLLPERYCDYLIALYTKGDESNVKIEQKKPSNGILLLAQLILLIIMVPLSFIVIYFTKFQPIMQIGILSIFCLFALTRLFSYKKKKRELYPLAVVTTLITLLLLTVYTAQSYISNQWILELVIFMNMVSWIIYAYLGKMNYLKVISTLGLIFAIIYALL